uniref:Uncharacterized protein MANES_05G026700 n=2 Tax=Rhizophora mucronata TaxID=61149 RepID=A0A2P2M2Y2_RHIMU
MRTGNVKADTKARACPAGEKNQSDKIFGATGVSGKSVGPVVSPAMTSAPETKNSPGANTAMASLTGIPQTPVLPSEGWLQNERELKRERRKQSNRESARRSRLRKQAETEDLARKVESLTAENVTLKSEINQLTERSEKLRLENAVLAEKLKNTQLGHTKGILLKDHDEQRAPADSTENLLARVNNSASADRKGREDDELYERNSKSGAKLHQLLDTSPRTDAVSAG